INFVTCHDGFTLVDLVSYEEKHNEANGEGNRDGNPHNLSWNCGVEGPTDDPGVLALRRRQRRNLVATLLLSLGVPMISGGDELGRTQRGNNNAYCHDSELSWYDWDLGPDDRAFLAFVQRVVALRREHPALRRSDFLDGRPHGDSGAKEVRWLAPDGGEMQRRHWSDPGARALGLFLAEVPIDERGEVPAGAMLILINGGAEPVRFRLPPAAEHERWERLLDTVEESEMDPERNGKGGERYEQAGHSLALFRCRRVGVRS